MKNTDPVYWTTKDGKKIDIDSMDINHLRNTLKMLVRVKDRISKKIKANKAFEFNGDMANEFIESATCPNCGEPHLSETCCGFDASEIDIY